MRITAITVLTRQSVEQLYRWKLKLTSIDPDLSILLLKAGDIEQNPGPESCPCDKSLGKKFIKCTDCLTEWHLECVGLKGITEGALSKLLLWKCVLCMNLPSAVKNQLAEKFKPENTEEGEDEEKEININEIYKEIKIVRSGVEKINSKISGNNDKQPTQIPNQPLYSNVMNKQLGANINKIVQHMNQERKVNNAEQTSIIQNRTLIVRQYEDKNIRNSESIRAPIREKFPGVVIRNARTTPGGSIFIEFDNENTAENVAKSWKKDLFGGNRGVMRGNVPRTTGIVKHVWGQQTEEEIEEEILSKYPCKVSFFKKNGKYMGIIKIIFNSPEDLIKTTEERIKIFEQRYLVEEFIFKPRVIKCNKCQNYGHIARLCLSAERCGKCAENHDTKSCNVEPKDFKCCHCKGNHEAGDKECQTWKNKEEQIKNRYHNG